ncbi:hypothetical protein MHEL_58160 [Mycolicibacterium helvum]|uniref:Uncharacterized protein n=1 Tax=Mycolicibacterium helvum TaxID=1534349 RepID=A0A7I7TFV0_9MYCO|nr:hypothetical protein MHEL_58160 [Mycolicibacterium helvum]
MKSCIGRTVPVTDAGTVVADRVRAECLPDGVAAFDDEVFAPEPDFAVDPEL